MCASYAAAMLWYEGKGFGMESAPWKYFTLSIANLFSTWCQYEALRYVSLVLQTSAKSFKMLPVMLLGIVVSRKKYSATDWVVVCWVVVGIALFAQGGQGGRISSGSARSAGHGDSGASALWGALLLLGFLAFDGFTLAFQEKLFEDGMSKYNQMLYMYLSAAIVSLVGLFASSSVGYTYAFLMMHQAFGIHVASLSLAAAAGQFYIFSTLEEFGALHVAAAMNCRQVATFCIAYVREPGAMTWTQVGGLCVLSFGLSLKVTKAFCCSRARATAQEGHMKLPHPAQSVGRETEPDSEQELLDQQDFEQGEFNMASGECKNSQESHNNSKGQQRTAENAMEG